MAPLSLTEPALVRAVLVGPVDALVRPEVRSAIHKRPVAGPVAVGALGLAGDQQADRRVHGGVDKAVHLYAWAHYAVWRGELASAPWLDAPGAFGENLSVDGLDEMSVCIGDQWRVGSAVLEVSQGRQPCWKLNLRFGVADMAARVQRTRRAGWYCRVLQPGELQAGDALQLLHRPHPDWPLARLLALIQDRACEAPTLEAALALPLTASWRQLFQRRLERGQAENWDARLLGSAAPSSGADPR